MRLKNSFLGYKHIHFVGIGGIGMSSLAKLCLNMGIKVSGSDKVKSHITEELIHLGANVFYKHQKTNIFGADLVVYTCAVGDKNIEVCYALKNGIDVLERADFLGEVAKCYKNVIAISGSHGKTTVCGMLCKIFETAGKKPTMIVGGEIGKNSNLVIGEKEFLIVEACEYKEHFLKIGHTIGAVLNIDYDHPDYFKTQIEYQDAFKRFAEQSKDAVFSDEKYSILLGGKIITFGSNGKYQAKRVRHTDNKIKFDVYKDAVFYEAITLNCIGVHNAKNALCAIAIADYFGVAKGVIKQGLFEFENAKRRYEYMGKVNNNLVITDYAHHPTQIKNVIGSTRQVYRKPVTVVFEPHTYSRTKYLFAEFVNALSLADNIMLLPTYSAREKSQRGGTSRDLFNALCFKKQKVYFVKSYKKCQKELEKLKDNVILILGAGSVIKLAETIRKNFLQNR